METWQDVIYVLAIAAFVLTLCSGIKAACRKKLRQGKDHCNR